MWRPVSHYVRIHTTPTTSADICSLKNICTIRLLTPTCRQWSRSWECACKLS